MSRYGGRRLSVRFGKFAFSERGLDDGEFGGVEGNGRLNRLLSVDRPGAVTFPAQKDDTHNDEHHKHSPADRCEYERRHGSRR